MPLNYVESHKNYDDRRKERVFLGFSAGCETRTRKGMYGVLEDQKYVSGRFVYARSLNGHANCIYKNMEVACLCMPYFCMVM